MKPPVDWGRIRMEYVLKHTPYRKLADKYGVNFKTLARRASAEGWVQLSANYEKQVSTSAMEQAVDKAMVAGVQYAQKLYDAGGRILEQVNKLLDLEDALAPRDLKSLSSVLVDLKNLYGVDEDAQEDGSGGVEVVFVARAKGAAK